MSLSQNTRKFSYVLILCAVILIFVVTFGAWIYFRHYEVLSGEVAPNMKEWRGLVGFFKSCLFILTPLGVVLFSYYSFIIWNLSKKINQIEQEHRGNDHPADGRTS